MTENQKPSASELPILKSLWLAHPQNAKQIHLGIVEQTRWTLSTTRKTLDRMVEKGFLAIAQQEGVRVYSPVLKKVTTLAWYINDLAFRVLEFNKTPPVSLFVNSELLNKTELAELENLLERGNNAVRASC